MTVTLNYQSISDKVSRSLSIIGKRSTDEHGRPRFTDITLGSLEKHLINDFICEAAIDIKNRTRAFVVDNTSVAASLSVTLSFPGNHNAALEQPLQDACDAYCVSFALHAWLVIVAPTIAEHYKDDCQRQMDAINSYLYEKRPPKTTTASYGTKWSEYEGTEDPGETPEEPDPLAQYDIRGEAKALLQYYWDGTYSPSSQPSNGDILLFDYGEYPIARYNPSVAHVSQFEVFDAGLEAGRTAYWVGNNLCVYRGSDGVGATPQDQNSNRYWTVRQNMREQ